MTAIPEATRRAVWERADSRCEGCGRWLTRESWHSIQHRRARGMGGTKDPSINRLSNLLLLCGTATSPGCHQRAESRESLAEVDGWWLPRGSHANLHPVRVWPGRWVYLTDAGTYREVEAA